METTPTSQPETTTPSPAITDRSTKPQGVIPKNMQSWVWIGVILVVAVGIFFSGGPKRPINAAAQTDQPMLTPVNPSGLTPDQVAKRLQESEQEARRNGLTPVQSANNQNPNQMLPGDSRYTAGYNPDQPFLNASQPNTAPTADPVLEEERKREYLGRYASNVALSYRTDSHPTGGGQLAQAGFSQTGLPALNDSSSDAPNGLPALPANFQQQLDSSMKANEQQIAVLQQQLNAATNAANTSSTPAAHTTSAQQARKTSNDANSSTGKLHTIFEGTVLECVLVNRLNGDFAGPIITQVTTDLYSHDHSTLLIPSGTRVLGEVRKVDALGQERLAVLFHRLIMPDGYAVDLDQAPGLNQIGETALKDKVNNHYFKIFGASIAVGALAGLSTIGTNNSAITGLPVSSADAYREGVASSLSQSSMQILSKFLNIPPTITIREGHRVRVFLTQDLQVPAYANHTMPSDL